MQNSNHVICRFPGKPGSRIEDRGSRIEDRGSRIEDRGSNEKKDNKITEICDRPARLLLLLLFRFIYIARFVSSL